MKKTFALTTAITLLTFFSALMFSCNKVPDFHSLTYKDTFSYHYGYIPDTAGGYIPELGLPAWFPNQGTGAATGMPNAICLFEVYATWNANYTAVINHPMPVNRYFKSTLAAAGIMVPDAVTRIVYDNHQNSIWFKADTIITQQLSATKVGTTSVYDVIGGSGKFAGARGHVREVGYFNPVDTTEAMSAAGGMISY